MIAYKPGDKPNGSVTTFMRKYRQGVRQGGVKVPCDGCTACCRSPKIKVELTENEAKEHPGAYFSDEYWRLPKNEDGSCIYLKDGACSIYSRRPFTCRTYDCRWHILVGLIPSDDPPVRDAVMAWTQFTAPTPEDMETAIAIKMAVADGGVPQDCSVAFRKASA
jgi:hypothetical protein